MSSTTKTAQERCIRKLSFFLLAFGNVCCCLAYLSVKTIENNRKKIKKKFEKNRKKSIIWSFQNWVIENRWSKKKLIVFRPINRKRSIIDFWSESLVSRPYNTPVWLKFEISWIFLSSNAEDLYVVFACKSLYRHSIQRSLCSNSGVKLSYFKTVIIHYD